MLPQTNRDKHASDAKNKPRNDEQTRCNPLGNLQQSRDDLKRNLHRHFRHTRGDGRTAAVRRKPEGARLSDRGVARATEHAEHGEGGGGAEGKLRRCGRSGAEN